MWIVNADAKTKTLFKPLIIVILLFLFHRCLYAYAMTTMCLTQTQKKKEVKYYLWNAKIKTDTAAYSRV